MRSFLGDLTAQDTDALVNPANSALVMGGGVAGAIRKAGGGEIEREAVQKAPVPVGRAVATKAGRLPVRFVIHSPTMAAPAMRTDLNAVRKSTRAALRLADDLGLQTLAFPGMGTGVGGISPDAAANAMIDEVKNFIDEKTGLKEIRFVCFEKVLLEAFEQAIHRLTQK